MTSPLQHASRRATEFLSHHCPIFPTAGLDACASSAIRSILRWSLSRDFRWAGPAATMGDRRTGCMSIVSASPSLPIRLTNTRTRGRLAPAQPCTRPKTGCFISHSSNEEARAGLWRAYPAEHTCL